MMSILRTTLTLAVLLAVLVGAMIWGYRQVTKPFPQVVDPPICEVVEIDAGTKVRPREVVVNVLNAGTRSGLAARTMGLLTEEGFVEGVSGNASRETKVPESVTWTSDRTDPAARLVRSYFRGRIIERPNLDPGITVVVGNRFDSLENGRRTVAARVDTETCRATTPD